MATVRLGSGLGFYGDSWRPVRASIERGDVAYIGSDHLSELTLAILAKDRARDPRAGYARDVLPMLRELLPLGRARGVRFICNAGGLNPAGAAEALADVMARAGLSGRIATVTGDAVLGDMAGHQAAGAQFAHARSGALPGAAVGRWLFANAYLGARPIVEALAGNADIVITGRVADAALFLAPLVHAHGWAWDDWDRLAAGTVVGHLLECSGQVSGGNFGGDWRAVPDMPDLGYAIAEVEADGTAVITKAPGTGGRVSVATVVEQLLYEVHDPFGYVTPDVIVDMGHITLTPDGPDRVKVSGVRGRPAPPELKVVAGYPDGHLAQVQLGYPWPDAAAKAHAAAETLLRWAAGAGLRPEATHVELLGHDSLLGRAAGAIPTAEGGPPEVYVRVAARFADAASAERFMRLAPALALSGPPGAAGYGGLQPPRELLGIWPTAIARERIVTQVSYTDIAAGGAACM